MFPSNSFCFEDIVAKLERDKEESESKNKEGHEKVNGACIICILVIILPLHRSYLECSRNEHLLIGCETVRGGGGGGEWIELEEE